MMLCNMLAAVAIAFPKAGQTLPPVSRTYMTGSVSPEVGTLTVQGAEVAIYRTGAWLAMVDLKPGENVIVVKAGGTTTNVTVRTEMPRTPAKKSAAAKTPPKPVEYKKLAYASDVARKHPFGKPRAETVIAIDPGHGGAADTGAVSPHGWPEKDANLAISLEVRAELEAMGYKVKLTRTDDRAIALHDRGRIACGADGADAFVSIHHNSTPCDKDPRLSRYTCVYAWNGIGRKLAEKISARTAAALKGDIPSNGVLHANFAVTRNPETPSCLVETDFLNTPEGEEAVWDAGRRRKLAAAIAAGVDDWCRTPPE